MVDAGPTMTAEPTPAPSRSPAKAPILDLGAGDPDAPANAIPNIIAHLVETETWRNAATVLTGVLLIVLGYWSYDGIRESIAEARVTSLEALLGTVVTGLDVWVGEHRTEAVRLARDPLVVARAARLAADARGQRSGAERCTAEAEDLGRILQASLATAGVVAFRIVDRTGLVLASKDPHAAGSACAPARSGSGSTSRSTACRSSCGPIPDRELSVRGATDERRPVAWFLAPIREGDGARVGGAGDGRGNRPPARDGLLRRAAGQYGGGLRVFRRRPHAHAVALRRGARRGGRAHRFRGGGHRRSSFRCAIRAATRLAEDTTGARDRRAAADAGRGTGRRGAATPSDAGGTASSRRRTEAIAAPR